MTTLLKLRPVNEKDFSFLFDVFVSTRPDIALVEQVPEEIRNELLLAQFNAQHQHYTKYYPDADVGIIEQGTTPIGRLYVNRTTHEIHILEIAVLEDFRSQGIGTTIINRLFEEGKLTNRSVRIHVEKMNPALKFYQRLGFEQIGDKPAHFEMRWQHQDSKCISESSR